MQRVKNPRCTTKMDRKVFDFGAADSGPGPAAYGVKTTVGRVNRLPNIEAAPAYTIKPRLGVNAETEGPGPVYNLANLQSNGGRATGLKYSMRARLAENAETDSPGPAAYMPRAGHSRSAVKILLPLKGMDARADNPGPNVYKLPSTLSQRGFSLAKKIDRVVEPKSPGPAVYKTVPLNKYKRKAPNFTFGRHFEDPLVASQMNDATPGPQAYNPTADYKYKRVPKFSFGSRRPEKFLPFVVCGDQEKKRKFNVVKI